MVEYRPRGVDQELGERLAASSAVLIEGPRACGKTEAARRRAESEVLLDVDIATQEAVAIDPRLVLTGPWPRLVDEWRLSPMLHRLLPPTSQHTTVQ